MNWVLPFAGVLLILALIVLLAARRQQKESGLPAGRVIAADMGGWRQLEKPLYDPTSGLTGRPDYILEQGGVLIPVEVKSAWAPGEPHESHIFQLAAYCLLVEKTSGKRPPYGILHYRNRTFAVDYTPTLEMELRVILEEMRLQQRRGEAARSHDQPARCTRCGFREICDDRL
jgi:CRISPR-associated exonuclease Cas4